MRVLAWLQPSRTVPVTRWRAPSRWRPRPSSLVMVVFGQFLFGVGDGLLVTAGLGVSPWTVLGQGLSNRLPITIGLATLIVSALVLLLWIPLRERPGPGTIANMLVIAGSLQLTVWLVPKPATALAFGYVFVAIALIGIGSGFYLTCNLGPGPRDGWMTGIHERTGWPVAWIRLAIEVTVLSIGWLLGGTVGFGTVAFAVLVGPSVGYGLMLAGRVGRVAGAPQMMVEEAQFPELDA